MRERTYYPELCVVQLGGADDVAVIDAQADGIDLAALGDLLADPAVVKVFHAARQDVEIFLELFGVVPTPIFDTQVAAMVAGFGDQVGYDALVASTTAGTIDKGHRFSDWSARPLSPAQVTYAAADVTWLRLVYQALCERLAREDRLDWVQEEMAVLAQPTTYRADPEQLWERLRPRSSNRRMLGLAPRRHRLARARGPTHQHPPPAPGQGREPPRDRRQRPRHCRRPQPHPRHHPRLCRGQGRHRPPRRPARSRRPARRRPPRRPPAPARAPSPPPPWSRS